MATGPIPLPVQPEDERRRLKCIELLERLLAEAKEGKGFETAFFIATLPDTTDLRWGRTEGLSTLDCVGRIEHLKHEMLQDMREGDGE